MDDFAINDKIKSKLYIPQAISEVNDLVIAMVGYCPDFEDKSGYFPYMSIHTTFYELVEGLGIVRKKLGEDGYAAAMERTARAKQLFVNDPNDDNGKTDEGIKLLYEIEDILQTAQKRRIKARVADDEGEITGD